MRISSKRCTRLLGVLLVGTFLAGSIVLFLACSAQEVRIVDATRQIPTEEIVERSKMSWPRGFAEHFRSVTRATLEEIDEYIPFSEQALELLVLTAAHESLMGRWQYSLSGGPERGWLQVRPEMEQDVWVHYLSYRPKFAMKVAEISDRKPFMENLAYQIVLARIKYARRGDNLPVTNDPYLLAAVWKRDYNTYLGKGVVERAAIDYLRYGSPALEKVVALR